jgi:hypothetical protein
MSLSNPRVLYGVHSFTPYNRSTGLYYGTIKVLQGSSFGLTGEITQLQGGSSRYSWAAEDGNISAELALTFKEYPDFMYELFLGKKPTANAAEASGDVSTLENKYGTTLVAATGIASVSAKAGSEADLKFTKYVVKAVGADTVDVYAGSDVDFATGADKEYETDLLKITATPLTIATGAAVEVPGYGLELTGGAGTIAFTISDTGTFEVRPINSSSSTVTIGGNTDVYPNFGALVVAQKRGNSDLFELDIFNLKALGAPHNFNAKEFSEAEITATAIYDSSKNGIFSMRSIVI